MLKQDSWGMYYEVPDVEEEQRMLIRDSATGMYSYVALPGREPEVELPAKWEPPPPPAAEPEDMEVLLGWEDVVAAEPKVKPKVKRGRK